MKLTGQQYQHLTDALLDAFRDQDSLAQMLKFNLNKSLSTIAVGSSLQAIIFRLIEVAEAEGWIPELIEAAHVSNSGNRTLHEFYQQYKSASNAQLQESDITLDFQAPEQDEQLTPEKGTKDNQNTSVSTSIINHDLSKQEVESNQSRTEALNELIEPAKQDFFATKHMHHTAIEQAFMPFKEGWNIYPEHCNRAIKSLDELDESLQLIIKNEVMLSYRLRGLLHQISEQVSNLRSEMYKCRKDRSPLTAFLKRRFHYVDYKKIRDQFDLLLKSLEQFDDAG